MGDGYTSKNAPPLRWVLDVGVNQEAVHLRVDVLHGDLEPIETPRLRDLHLLGETLHLTARKTHLIQDTFPTNWSSRLEASTRVKVPHQVFIDNSITGSKEGQDVGDEVPLLILQRLPVLQVLGQIHLDVERMIEKHKHSLTMQHSGLYSGLGATDLFCGPERGLGLLVHLPDVLVLDGEDDKATGVLLQQWFHLLLTSPPLHWFGLKGSKVVVRSPLDLLPCPGD